MPCTVPHRQPCLDTKEVRTLVLWLEEMKIRSYALNDRAELRKIDSQDWNTTFCKYLKDLECTKPCSNQMSLEELQVVIDWLLGNAITAEYSDHAAQYNQLKKDDFLEKGSSGSDNKAKTLDCSSKEFGAAVSQLVAALKLPTHQGVDPAVVLGVVAKRLETKTAQQKAEGNKQAAKSADVKDADSKADTRTALAELEQMPLGFDTQDKLVNQAARVLRLLYISNLRDLQTTINEVLVLVQEYTARQSEMADTKLGQVGR